jgi:hypothetical protein
MPRYHVTIYGSGPEAMADLVRKHHVTVLRRTLRRTDQPNRGFGVAALADIPTISALKSAGYEVDQHEDVDKTAKKHLAEVGKGNRYLKPPARAKTNRRKKS